MLPDFELFSCVDNLQPTGDENQWMARCPAHDDQTNSLAIGYDPGNKQLLVNCFSGCNTGDVLAACGLTVSALFPPINHDQSSGQVSAKTKKPKSKIVASYTYEDEERRPLFQSCRMEPKTFLQRRALPEGGWKWGVRGVRKVLYRLPELNASNPDSPVFIVEGEKDVDRLRSMGLVATTNVGGAGKWSDDYNAPLQGRKAVLLPDNDAAGMNHARIVAKSLSGVTKSVKIVELPNLPKKGDVSDWLDAGGTQEQFIDAIKSAPEWTPESEEKSKPEVKRAIDDPHRLAEAFINSYSHEKHEAICFRYWRERFYIWTGDRYEQFSDKEIRPRITAFIEQEFNEDNIRKQLGPTFDANNVYAKKVTSGIVSNVLQAVTSRALVPFKCEQPGWLGEIRSSNPKQLLPMRNGILDIEKWLQGESDVLIPHTPEFFSTVCLPYDYNPGVECPNWQAFLKRNLPEQEQAEIVQEWFGYCLLPDTSFQKFMMFCGEGSNGKSVVCAALTATLGQDNVSHKDLENFAKDFGLESMVGKLANIAADMGDIDKVAEGTLKKLTSGDRVTIQRKHISDIEIVPTARLTFATNSLPRINDRSNGLWRRMLYLPLNVTISEEERIPNMDKPWWWEQNSMLSGLLNWSLQGLKRLRTNGRFTDSPLSQEAIGSYKTDSNPARAFLLENYTEVAVEDGGVISKEVYNKYKEWCSENTHHPLSSNMFGKEIKRLFPNAEHGKVRNEQFKRVNGYFGISEINSDSFTANPDSNSNDNFFDWPDV